MKKFMLLAAMIAIPSFAAVSSNVSFTTDYIWRGMTQSDGPAIQGGFDYEADSGFYAGVWGSNVNFGNGTGSELDYYAGYSTELSDNVGIDFGYLVFDYPDSTPDLKFEEIYLGLSFGDLGFLYASGQDSASDYLEISYAVGPVSFSHGQYDEMGENTNLTFSFECGSYDCGITAYDFTDDGYSGVDEDGIYLSVSASL